MVLRVAFLGLLMASCAGNNGQGENIRLESLSGDELYRNNCTACHGSNGDAGVGGASALSTSTLDHHAIQEIIEKGRNAMPPQTHAYKTDEELDNLIDHIISLRRK